MSSKLTVYSIQAGRGFAQAAAVLGEDFSGTLVRDGWQSYRLFIYAVHQSCLAHITRRVAEILETARGGAARVPRAVRRILEHAFELRSRRNEGKISPHGMKVAVGILGARLDRLLEWNPTNEENRTLLKHLQNERDALFTFLLDPEVPATNHWAERAIRPAVVTRKVCGGNRTWNGAHVQEILASVLRSCHQQGLDPRPFIIELLRATDPVVLDALNPLEE